MPLTGKERVVERHLVVEFDSGLRFEVFDSVYPHETFSRLGFRNIGIILDPVPSVQAECSSSFFESARIREDPFYRADSELVQDTVQFS